MKYVRKSAILATLSENITILIIETYNCIFNILEIYVFKGSKIVHFLDLDAVISGMIERQADGASKKYGCTLCGKTMAARHHMRNHIETHMAVVHNCEVPGCSKVFKTRNSRTVHYSTYHKTDPTNIC